MKIIAVLLIGCMLFLSAFPGMANATGNATKMDCCKKAAGKYICHHQPVKKTDGCEKPGCAMLFSCSTCGFIPVGTLMLPADFSFLLKQPVPLYKTGPLSTYNKADWKPPKSC